MGTIRRQSIQGTLILVSGVLLALVLRLIIFTKFLDEEQIGLLAVLLDAANLFAAFIPLGSQSIFIKYLPYFRNEQGKPRGLLFTGLSLTALGLSIFLLTYFLFQDKLVNFYSDKAPLLSQYFFYLLPLVIVRVIYVVGQSYSQALKKNIFPLIIKEILVRILTALLVLGFAGNWFDFDGLVFWYVFIYFISGSIMTGYLAQLRQLDLRPQRGKLSGSFGRQIFSFGFFTLLYSGGAMLTRNVDTIMIATFSNLGTEDNLKATGIYTIAFLIGMIIELPRRAISQITTPFIADAMAKNRLDQIAVLYHKSSINQFLAGALLFILVWTNLDSLYALMPKGEIYRSGVWVVFFIGLSKLFDMSMGVNSQIIQNSQYYKFNTYSMVLLATLAVGSNVVLIPLYGINGAAIASFISLSLINIIRSAYIKSRLDLQPFRFNSVIALIIGGASWLLAYFLPEFMNPYLDIIYRGLITTFVFSILVLATGVSEDLNEFANDVRKRLRV